MYVAVGLGVLTKGPVAAVIPRARVPRLPRGASRAAPAARDDDSRRRPDRAGHGGAVVRRALPAARVDATSPSSSSAKTSAAITETVGVQARGPLFYLPVVLTDALPWSLCLPAVVVAWVRDRRHAARDDVRAYGCARCCCSGSSSSSCSSRCRRPSRTSTSFRSSWRWRARRRLGGARPSGRDCDSRGSGGTLHRSSASRGRAGVSACVS